MKHYTYVNEKIEVTFDQRKCCHATHCFKELPDVFDGDFDPPIRPDNASVEEIIRVVEMCPSSALTYNRLDGEKNEIPLNQNSAKLFNRGPLLLKGDFEVEGDGTLTRIALCRCGESNSKPYCDGSHRKVEFSGPPQVDADDCNDFSNEGRVTFKPIENGPILFSGKMLISKSNGEVLYCRESGAICRCGASNSKPFCDGSHQSMDFKT